MEKPEFDKIEATGMRISHTRENLQGLRESGKTSVLLDFARYMYPESVRTGQGGRVEAVARTMRFSFVIYETAIIKSWQDGGHYKTMMYKL